MNFLELGVVLFLMFFRNSTATIVVVSDGKFDIESEDEE